MPNTDHSLLRAALVGYEAQLAEITERIAALKKHLGGRSSRGGGGDIPTPFKKRGGRRRMSAAARARIAAAQKARWAAYRKAKAK